MNPILQNILAVVAGIVVGSGVNMGLLQVGMDIIPPPEGIDFMDPESIKANMHLFETKHFITPFLAHALGTLLGAFIAARIAATQKMTFAMVIGGFFLLGGIANVMMLPAPLWFNVVDLGLAYFPMAWLGGRMGGGTGKPEPEPTSGQAA